MSVTVSWFNPVKPLGWRTKNMHAMTVMLWSRILGNDRLCIHVDRNGQHAIERGVIGHRQAPLPYASRQYITEQAFADEIVRASRILERHGAYLRMEIAAIFYAQHPFE